MKRSILAFIVALTAGSAVAAEDGYPPGLFEHSPVVGPDGSRDTQGAPPDPGDSPDAAGQPNANSGGPPDANGALDDYCASIASRTFHSLAEVRRAHARCDQPPPDQ
jgi:hypothetical protein